DFLDPASDNLPVFPDFRRNFRLLPFFRQRISPQNNFSDAKRSKHFCPNLSNEYRELIGSSQPRYLE
ncbi:MAG TPA: hypothetical protein PKH07_18590, partial [bacterium]|nr:hypothetical protein [bacterium]